MKIGIRTLHSAIKEMFSKKIVMLRKKNISSYEKKGRAITDANENCAQCITTEILHVTPVFQETYTMNYYELAFNKSTKSLLRALTINLYSVFVSS